MFRVQGLGEQECGNGRPRLFRSSEARRFLCHWRSCRKRVDNGRLSLQGVVVWKAWSMTKATVLKSVLSTLVIAILIVVSAALYVSKRRYERSSSTRVTMAQVDAQIKQHVPIGSPREKVATYLDAQKIVHSFLGGDLYRNTADYNCEIPLIPHTDSSGLITTDIQIVFKFDNAMKLVSYNVREISKGP